MIVPSYVWIISLFLLLCKDVLCGRQTEPGLKNERIVGGYSESIHNVPYQAFLLLELDKENRKCGGSIISNRVILTAAHCLTGVLEVTVRVGSSLSDSGGSIFKSNDFIQHPKFDANTSDYDVGVIYLPRPIKLNETNKKRVKLPDSGTCVKPGTKLLISGWGAEEENGTTITHLRAVDLNVVDIKKCEEAHDVVTCHMFCAGNSKGGQDSCQGDSGGPAVSMNKIQLGIVSFGVGCGRDNNPGVYTNVATVRKWIESVADV